MKKSISFLGFIATFSLLFTFSPLKIQAICGSYNPAFNQCFDIRSNSTVIGGPETLCAPSDAVDCCNPQSECTGGQLPPQVITNSATLECSVNGNTGISTAIGCLDVSGAGTITTLASWGTGISLGISLLLIVVASIQITSAAGDAKKVKAGQELLTSGLAGAFLIALAIVLLNFIGVNILGLQNLGFSSS